MNNKWPTATRFEIRSCPRCPNAHIVLFDEEDRQRCQMTLSREGLPDFIEAVEGAFAAAKMNNLARQLKEDPQ